MSEKTKTTTNETNEPDNNEKTIQDNDEDNQDNDNQEKIDDQDQEEIERQKQSLLDYGLDQQVVARLLEVYASGQLKHVDLDARALDALREFPPDGALIVLGQFVLANLEHVSNKSAYLCGVMKTYRQKRGVVEDGMMMVKRGETGGKGPDEGRIREILARTKYTLDVTTGQRKYGGPPPGWDSGTGNVPGAGCEVFCGKIPKDMYEDELIPLFEQCGTIWDLRLMMDPMTGTNRGYAFVTFTTREAAQIAVQKLNEHEVRATRSGSTSGGVVRRLGVTRSHDNRRLFVGYIPKNRGRAELAAEFDKHAPGLTEVIIYSSPDDKKKNRGFCFLEYESHKSASLAKRRLGTGRIKVWGCDIIVDWADPQEQPDEQTMSRVKVLYVRNLTQDVSEERLKEEFEKCCGKVERVKKIKDYAFVHFEEREHAVKAMNELDGKELLGSNIEVSLAKPPSDKKKKEEVLRARERRMFQMLQVRGGGGIGGGSGVGGMLPSSGLRGPPGPGRAGGMRGGGGNRGDYDYDFDNLTSNSSSCYGGYTGDYMGGYCDPYYDQMDTMPSNSAHSVHSGDEFYYEQPVLHQQMNTPSQMNAAQSQNSYFGHGQFSRDQHQHGCFGLRHHHQHHHGARGGGRMNMGINAMRNQIGGNFGGGGCGIMASASSMAGRGRGADRRPRRTTTTTTTPTTTRPQQPQRRRRPDGTTITTTRVGQAVAGAVTGGNPTQQRRRRGRTTPPPPTSATQHPLQPLQAAAQQQARLPYNRAADQEGGQAGAAAGVGIARGGGGRGRTSLQGKRKYEGAPSYNSHGHHAQPDGNKRRFNQSNINQQQNIHTNLHANQWNMPNVQNQQMQNLDEDLDEHLDEDLEEEWYQDEQIQGGDYQRWP